MNQERRKRLQEIQKRIFSSRTELDHICNDEQWEFDNLPYAIQNEKRRDLSQVAVYAIGVCTETLDEAVSLLRGACE